MNYYEWTDWEKSWYAKHFEDQLALIPKNEQLNIVEMKHKLAGSAPLIDLLWKLKVEPRLKHG